MNVARWSSAVALCVLLGSFAFNAVVVDAVCPSDVTSCTTGSTSGNSSNNGNGTLVPLSGQALASWQDCGGDTLFWPYPNAPQTPDSVPEPMSFAQLNPKTDFILNDATGALVYPGGPVPGNPENPNAFYYTWGCANFGGQPPSVQSYAFNTGSNTTLGSGSVETNTHYMLVLTPFTATAYSPNIGFTGCAGGTLTPSGGVTICSYGSLATGLIQATISTWAGPVDWTTPPASFTKSASGGPGPINTTPPAGTGLISSYAYPGYEHVYPVSAGGPVIQIESWRYIYQSCSYTVTTQTTTTNAAGQLVTTTTVQGPTACTTSVFTLAASGPGWATDPSLSTAQTNVLRGTQQFTSVPFAVQQIEPISKSS